MRIIDQFIESIRSAASYNPEVQAAPHCILWTDQDRQWEVIIGRLQDEMPELFILGDYQPEQRQGPAIWLRCILAETLDDIQLPEGLPPTFYLPGVSRQDLRAVDSCPDHLKPLAELQYRGVIWSQVNAKDWTVMAFLQTHQGGLGLDVAQDKETKTAMQLALPSLMDTEVSRFRGKRLDKDDFYQLISKDPAGELLKWLNDGNKYRQQKTTDEWRAFVELCRYHFAFNPETEGVISGAEKLAHHSGAWEALWERFKEVAARYKGIPQRIRLASPPSNTLDWLDPSSDLYQGWPQWNDEQEKRLRDSLKRIFDMPLGEAQKLILDLDRSHGHRREMIWAELGLSPLANALQHLKTMAEVTRSVTLDGGTVTDLANGYQTSGWQVDNAVMQALAVVQTAEDRAVINTVLDSIYQPWATTSARYLQQIIDSGTYPGSSISNVSSPPYQPGTCILFIDGLRFDIAKRLSTMLDLSQYTVVETTQWVALPSVTATGKPSISPVRNEITAHNISADFEPEISVSGKPANHRNHMKLLEDSDWQVLDRTETGNPGGLAWTELDAIDKSGHDGNLPQRLDGILNEIKDRISHLLEVGWQRIDIVTDHGWLFLPNGLPKVALAQSLTDNQWGRCASVKPGASIPEKTYPWFWNPDHYFALADGISCFRAGISYAHGGLSLQECFTIHLAVTQSGVQSSINQARIIDVDWRGLRCDVRVDGGSPDMILDIRTEPGNSDTSIILSEKSLKTSGKTSLLVPNDELLGKSATIVITLQSGQLIAQEQVIIGGEDE